MPKKSDSGNANIFVCREKTKPSSWNQKSFVENSLVGKVALRFEVIYCGPGVDAPDFLP